MRSVDIDVIALLYILEIVLFRVSGGTGAAGNALRRWRRSNSGGGYLDSVLPETT